VNANVRAVDVVQFAACPYSIAGEYAVEYLRRAEAGAEEAEIRVPVRLLPSSLHRHVTVTFGLHLDETEIGRPHDEIRLSWRAGTPLLPDFNGTLRFRIAGQGTDVIVAGTYRVPLGALGRVFDDVIGHRIAVATMGDLAHRIAQALEANERAWRARVPVG
jgi:hypothetical protein